MSPSGRDPSTHVRVLQGITLALLVALAALGAVAVFLTHGQPPPKKDPGLAATYTGVVMVVLGGVLSVVLPLAMPGLLKRAFLPDSLELPAGMDLLNEYSVLHIVRVVLCWVPGLLCLFAYMREGGGLALAGAVAAAALVAVRFPTAGRVQAWLRRRGG